MLFAPNKTGASAIEGAINLFTTAQTELSEGIALSKHEAKEKEREIAILQTSLKTINEKQSYGEAVYANITALLNPTKGNIDGK